MSLQRTLHFFGGVLKTDPLALPDMVRRRALEALLPTPHGVASSRFGDVRFDVDLDLHVITRKYHFHTHEMYLERIFRRHLRPGNVFVDIGANLGYWSAFAAHLVGPSGEVHAFEPVPQLFASLERLRDINPGHRFVLRNVACGAAPGVVKMAVVRPSPENFDNFDTNIGSNSILPGFLDHRADLTETIDVEVIRFDDHVAERALDLDRVGLVKIDVEGSESRCFDGMEGVLGRAGRRVPILCEILTDRTRAEPLDGAAVIRRLEGYGYTCLDATTLRPIDPEALAFEENILCL